LLLAARPGTIHRFDARARPIPTSHFRCSTHAFGVGGAIELALTMNPLHASLTVFGIEGKAFGPNTEFSPDVEKAVGQAVELVLLQIRASGHDG